MTTTGPAPPPPAKSPAQVQDDARTPLVPRSDTGANASADAKAGGRTSVGWALMAASSVAIGAYGVYVAIDPSEIVRRNVIDVDWITRVHFGASGASLLLGPHFKFMEMTILPGYHGFLLMLLPPGGFVVMGLLLALGRLRRALIAKYVTARRTPVATTATA